MTKVVTIFGNVTDKCNIGQPNLPPLPVPRGLPIQSATFATRQRQITKVLPTTLYMLHNYRGACHWTSCKTGQAAPGPEGASYIWGCAAY